MAKLVDLSFDQPPAPVSGSVVWPPALAGCGDVGAVRTGLMQGSAGNGATGSFLTTNTTLTYSSRTVNTVDLNNSLASPTNGDWQVWPATDQRVGFGTTLTTWSLRMVVNLPITNGSITPANNSIIQIREGVTSRGIISQFAGSNGWGGAGQVFTNNTPAALSGTYRMEIQADSSQTPSMIARIYPNDGTSQGVFAPVTGGTAGTSAANMNNLRFGDIFGVDNASIISRIAEIEFWDTRDADGAFTNNWTTANTSGYAGAPRGTGFTRPGDLSVVGDSVPLNAPGTVTSHLNTLYGSNSRAFDLYIPDGTAPANGWPVVLWAHSGFFVTGSKSDLITHWRNRLLNAGYAVCSVGYIRSSVVDTTYSAWGTSNTGSSSLPGYGRFPSWIVDFKLAAARLRDRYADGLAGELASSVTGRGIDPTKMYACGYSAGGYIALAAALTKGLTSDGSARNLTIAGNAANYGVDELGGTGAADPTFLKVFAYNAPVSMTTAAAFDWSHDYSGANRYPPLKPADGLQTGQGLVKSAIRSFMGLVQNGAEPSGATFTNTDITALIDAQYGALGNTYIPVDVGYSRGSTDYLVHDAHETLLAAKEPRLASYNPYVVGTNHDRADEVYRITDLTTFLAAPQGTGPSGSSSGTPSLPLIPSLPSIP